MSYNNSRVELVEWVIQIKSYKRNEF